MNTDGIYGKDVTYRDDLTPDEMATHAFRNYDPDFQTTAKRGDILVGGRNFGSGSSREQAATAIQFFGIPLVVAASFSQTYKRNAFNNGFPVLECVKLVDDLAKRFTGDSRPTIRTGLRAKIDFRNSKIVVADRTFSFVPLGEVPQRLVIAGGAEAWVRESLV
jgi:homoaconitate hydratase